MEEWRDIEGYEGLYQVSNLGRVKSLERIDNNNHPRKEKILTPSVNEKGYLYVRLCKNGIQKYHRINRLVGLHFIPIPERLKNIPIEKLEVGHLKKLTDGTEDKTANEVWNLAWMTRRENLNYGIHNERMAKTLSKPVLQFDLKNNFIKEWNSAAEIERQLGYANTNISACCTGKRKSTYGYIWQFKNG